MKKETTDIKKCNEKQVYIFDEIFVEVEGDIPSKLYLCAEAEESYITEVNLTKVTENCGCN